MRKRRKANPVARPMQNKMQEDRTPAWVKGMHAFRNEHGFYRTEDVLRALGDPAKTVEVPVVFGELAAAGIKRYRLTPTRNCADQINRASLARSNSDGRPRR